LVTQAIGKVYIPIVVDIPLSKVLIMGSVQKVSRFFAVYNLHIIAINYGA
jgi:hypothetical protein